MAYKLERIEDDEMANHLEKRKWLEKFGDYNKSPGPLKSIPQAFFADVLRRNIPLYIESRQLLDRQMMDDPFRTAIIYWFHDGGIMMLLPEISYSQELGQVMDWNLRQQPEAENLASIGYFWIGCWHDYSDRELDIIGDPLVRVKECQLCGYTRYIPI